MGTQPEEHQMDLHHDHQTDFNLWLPCLVEEGSRSESEKQDESSSADGLPCYHRSYEFYSPFQIHE
jgi:hypothetical protein